MANYLIVAQDEIYQGEHGIEDWTIEEHQNEQEAFMAGRDMSLDLIDSFSAIYDIFKDDAECWADQEEEEGRIWTSAEREKYIYESIEEQREDDVRYLVWKLSDRFDYSEITSEDIDWRDIVDTYGEVEY